MFPLDIPSPPLRISPPLLFHILDFPPLTWDLEKYFRPYVKGGGGNHVTADGIISYELSNVVVL